ncbi:MAG: putative xanthine dehydrogenase subunit D [Candidatus Izimaplasma bacterium HR2]|nr:MAG: putative xanthine dehydrogenase subunit D [Candidatus Izimaplasma bacterium HR2]
MKDITTSVLKIDNEEKSKGSAIYVSDITIPGMYYAKTVRSTISKGKIQKITLPEMPENYTIVDYKDIPGKNIVRIIFEDQKIFAEDEVTYYGEPIMLVVGPDKLIIEELVKQIKIEYIEETPVFEYVNSAINYNFKKGDAKSAFENADKVIKYDYVTGYQEQLYIEPQGMVVDIEGDKVTLTGSLQCPYYVKNAVLSALDAKDSEVRVIQAVVGGAFGGKEEFPSLTTTQLAVAAKKIGKPIKMIYEREEDMEVTTKRHPSKINMEAAISKDKEILAFRANVGLDAGANIGLSGVVLSRALIACTGAYTIDDIEVNGDVFLTNTVPNGAYRGFGAPQMLFAVEMFMHHIAKEIDCDPLKLRLRYLSKQGDATSTQGTFNDPIIMNDMIKKAMKESDYKAKKIKYAKEDVYKGIGMSWFLHGCGFTGSGESTHINALVKLRKDKNDKVHILIAAVDMGQGIRTTMMKIVSQVLDIPLEQTVYDLPNTDLVPDSGPTVASRTIMIVGGLVARAAKQLKENWTPGEELTVSERYKQPEYIKWDEDNFVGDAYPAYSWGVNIVEVEVCPVTYQVTLQHVWSVYDVGKAIDERIIMGQADGGIMQGIGYGYLEVMNSKDGRIQQKNVTDYIIPTSVDSPPLDTYLMDNPYPLGPYGAKGAGELTLVGGAPAVALAIEEAIGKKIHKIPVTPEYIMELMKNGKN